MLDQERKREGFLLYCAMFALIVLAASAVAQSQEKKPLAGTWQANIAKSKRHPNHLFSSATLRFEVADDVVTMTYTGVNMSGVEESGTFAMHPDGKEHPISGASGLVEVSRWVGTRVLETSARQNGKEVGHSTYEVSEDGKTLTATISGSDASGLEFQQVIVCDRK